MVIFKREELIKSYCWIQLKCFFHLGHVRCYLCQGQPVAIGSNRYSVKRLFLLHLQVINWWWCCIFHYLWKTMTFIYYTKSVLLGNSAWVSSSSYLSDNYHLLRLFPDNREKDLFSTIQTGTNNIVAFLPASRRLSGNEVQVWCREDGCTMEGFPVYFIWVWFNFGFQAYITMWYGKVNN